VPRSSDVAKAAIKNAVDIVRLAGDYGLYLHRAGSRYKATCPWHDDRHPSLEVNPERQTFKCWVCDVGGDVFEFVQRMDRVDFPEALRILAERAGVALDEPRSAGRSEGPSRAELRAVLAWAEGLFEKSLETNAGARTYIKERGLSAATSALFRLGFAPDDPEWLFEAARRKGWSRDLLEKAGLAVAAEESGGRARVRFRGRLIFPIHDEQGRPVGFGGRILPEAERAASSRGVRVAKYVNSPETTLFQKRRLLYAADLARASCREAGWVAVMEGYTDVMAARQAGLANAVATLGTAFGDEHVPPLRRLAERACLVYDGDEAGQSAAERALEVFLGHELDVRVLSLPSGLDPCDFLLNEGADAFRTLADSALDPLAFVLERARARFDLDSIDGARGASEWVLGVLARAPAAAAGSARDVALKKALDKLAVALRLPVASLQARLKALRSRAARRGAKGGVAGGSATVEVETAPGPSPAEALRAMDPIDRELAAVALGKPELVAALVVRVPPSLVRDDVARAILDVAYEIYGGGGVPSLDAVRDRLEDPLARAVAEYLSDLREGLERPELDPLDAVQFPIGTWEARLEDVLVLFAERERSARLRDLKQALDETDKRAEPGAHRALQLEYRRLMTQRAGALNPKKSARPDPTYRA